MCFTCYISLLYFYKKTYQKWCDKLFFVSYKKVPYDKDGNPLIAEMTEEPKTHRPKPTGRVFDITFFINQKF